MLSLFYLDLMDNLEFWLTGWRRMFYFSTMTYFPGEKHAISLSVVVLKSPKPIMHSGQKRSPGTTTHQMQSFFFFTLLGRTLRFNPSVNSNKQIIFHPFHPC